MPQPRTQPALFNIAWAIYTLVHTVATASDWKWGAWVLIDLVPAAAAVWLLLRPDSVKRLATLAAVWSLLVLVSLPVVANHSLLTLFMNLTILVCLFSDERGRSPEGRLARGFERFAPLLRLQLVIVYTFVVFHKLNTGFLTPEHSAAHDLYLEVVGSYPVLPASLPAWIPIWGTLAAEAALAVGLCFRRTIPYAVGFGLAFHLLLGLHPNPYILSFSSMLFGLYTLSLPGLLEPLRRRLEPAPQEAEPTVTWSPVRRGVLGGVALVLLGLALVTPFPEQGADPAAYIRFVGRLAFLGLTFCFVASWLSLDVSRARVQALSWTTLRQTPRVAQVLLVLLVFNGLCPYLGLKTGSAFAMYSNLYTEGGRCNHLLMPCQGLRVADFQEDLVEILESSSEDLNHVKERGWMLTWFEFRRVLAQEKAGGGTFFVRYRRHDEERTLRLPEHASDEAFTPPAWLARTLLHFRPVPLNPAMRAEHWE